LKRERDLNAMIMSILKIEIPPEKQLMVLETLRYVSGSIRVKPGFINWRILKDLGNSDSLTIVEEWDSIEDLHRHVRSEDYRATLALIDMSSKPPDLRFNSVLQFGDMDSVFEIRAK
jgi:quinol monooxygenase YgiN